jgi:hypothetical protein
MEAGMHGSFDKPNETIGNVHDSWRIGIFALPGFAVVLLIGLAMSNSGASTWISQAVQAELASTNWMPDVVPTQFAKPTMEIRTVKAF